MTDYNVDSGSYYGSATGGIPGATACPACEATLRTASAPDPDEVTSILDRECPDCDYETVVAVVWFPENRYLVVSDPLVPVSCEHDDCDDDARLLSILSNEQMIRRHCLDHVKGHLKSVSADARLL